MVGPFLVHSEKPLEIVLAPPPPVDHQLAFLIRFGVGQFPVFEIVGKVRIHLLQFKNGVLLKLLVDTLLQRQDRQLENLHRLDHPRRQHLLLGES